ncbi:MAG: hypothetical protein CHACPFDD_00479 [Phycisphaerae bacterium]|nr:hypothetical protein [Phycisphaerae bacterium]
MIFDLLDRADRYTALDPRVAAGLRFLRQADLGRLECGRFEIEGEHVFALVQEYETRPTQVCLWEAHRRYADIQCVASGSERMGFGLPGNFVSRGDYDADRDVEFFDGRGDELLLLPGCFCLLPPGDVHRPCMAVEVPVRVRKIVVKVEWR